MGKLFSLIKPVATKFIIAMVQKQVENTITKIGQELNADIFGEKIKVADIPFSNSMKRELPNIEKLPHNRALNALQKKKMEEKLKRKRERMEEVKEKKNVLEVKAWLDSDQANYEKAKQVMAGVSNPPETISKAVGNLNRYIDELHTLIDQQWAAFNEHYKKELKKLKK